MAATAIKKAARLRIASVPGIGAALAARLVDRGILTDAHLRAVILELPKETQIHLQYNVVREIPLVVGRALVAELKRRVSFLNHRKYPVLAVGSVRRGSPTSKDIDVLVVVPDKVDVQGILASAELEPGGPQDTLTFESVYASGQRRHSFLVRYGSKYYAVDMFLARREEKPFALFHFTNGRKYNIRIRAHAKKAGYTLNQYGIFQMGGQKRAPRSSAIRTERDITDFLGVTYRTPRQRATA